MSTSTLRIEAHLPRGYVARPMYLYIAKTRRRWGFWFSDARGYSVPARFAYADAAPDSNSSTMMDHFTTRTAAAAWALSHGWQVWPKSVTKGVPAMLDSRGDGTAATRSTVCCMFVGPRGGDSHKIAEDC
jgi:hypothetical protein